MKRTWIAMMMVMSQISLISATAFAEEGVLVTYPKNIEAAKTAKAEVISLVGTAGLAAGGISGAIYGLVEFSRATPIPMLKYAGLGGIVGLAGGTLLGSIGAGSSDGKKEFKKAVAASPEYLILTKKLGSKAKADQFIDDMITVIEEDGNYTAAYEFAKKYPEIFGTEDEGQSKEAASVAIADRALKFVKSGDLAAASETAPTSEMGSKVGIAE